MSTPFLAQIEIFSFGFAPKGWAQCNGQLLPINQNQALFSLLGTTYGGDGRVNFGLPNLQGRVPISMGGGFNLGELGGEQNHTLTLPEMPLHNHPLSGNNAAGTISTPATNTVLGKSSGATSAGLSFAVNLYSNSAPSGVLAQQSVGANGGSQPHNNMMPYLTLNMCIALQGIFPSQN
jgi:microcystin-dependent protein